MKLRIAVVAACASTLALPQIDLAQTAIASAAASTSQQRTADLRVLSELMGVPGTLKPPLASIEARKDIGCTGWHGKASGESKKGKCITKKHA